MPFKDIWKDKVNEVDEVDADDINSIAHEVIRLGENENGNSSITVDSEMSDTSTNTVQNKVIKAYVDNSVGVINAELTNTIALCDELIGG